MESKVGDARRAYVKAVGASQGEIAFPVSLEPKRPSATDECAAKRGNDDVHRTALQLSQPE